MELQELADWASGSEHDRSVEFHLCYFKITKGLFSKHAVNL